MSLKPFNSVAGITVGDNPPVPVILANGDITTTNLTANGISDLGSISNVKITGGTTGQTIVTDGSGNLSFANVAADQSAAPMPTYIAVGNTVTIPNNYQGLFGYPITVDGALEVEGILIDVNDSTVPAGNISYVQYNNGNLMGGSASFTFVDSTGVLTAPLVKTSATTFSGLPLPSIVGAGVRSFITDASTTTFLATVTGGGSNSVPVVSNGTNWIVG